jgi:hypothetical protein
MMEDILHVLLEHPAITFIGHTIENQMWTWKQCNRYLVHNVIVGHSELI